MDAGVTKSIEMRRGAFYHHYDLPPEAQARVEEFFELVWAFGRGCDNQAEFEVRFADSPLEPQMRQLFADCARYVILPEGVPTAEEHRREVAASQARSVARGQAERAVKSAVVRAMPDWLHEVRTYGVYNIPVIGRLFSAGNTANVFGRLFRRRKQQDNNETSTQ